MNYLRAALPLTFILLLSACGNQSSISPPAAPPPEEQPSNDPYIEIQAGQWRVTYTSSTNSSDTVTYALNIKDMSGGYANEGFDWAIICQSQTVCNYRDGAYGAGSGTIRQITSYDGRSTTLEISIINLDSEHFFFGENSDGTVETDSQGRQVIDTVGYGSLNTSLPGYTDGTVTAVRVGEARFLNPAPPEEPTPIPPEDPEPPTDPIQPPPEEPEPTPEPPTINSFTASSGTIESGDDVRLRWDVDNAETLRISPDVGTVTGSSVVIEPDETTTYTLTATNDDGSDQASVRVRVEDPEPEPEPEPEEPKLEYWVNSDCGEVSTTYATAGGGTAQRDFGNGVVYRSDDFSSGDFVYISAQNQCDSGDVTVRIYKRGNIYRETSSSGAYVIATASGTY